ncbi:MarR family winged helix-turn-helix transcriptional regulator [Cellulomonas sp. C5510]|uniref:MarR family winged helix-turn-helix transcriptional regulator n=1 Tax=Cellulomonas sp. C5510 TaxID=2871170 RepID=UPI001C95528D|nr:MarR family transcriptional regulator [Cellulomonas sp. C5510]QZN86229.1 MarR family transcriptional regulator [Cellulomonas sp. C5510]
MARRRATVTAAEVADEFSRTAKVLVRRLDERLGEHGVSTPRSRLVVEVARSQPVRLTELAHAVGIAQGTASTLVDGLVRDGLLERRPSADDRRSVLLHVTPDGADLASAWVASYERATDELFAVLDDDELTALAVMLRKLGAAPTGDAPGRPAPD